MALCILLLLPLCVVAAPAKQSRAAQPTAHEGILFEKRRITDPQFGGAVAATVNLPQGWTLEGKVDWNFQNYVKPAYVGYDAKAPTGDAQLSFAGPYVVACYFSQSPSAAMEAQYLGRLLVPPMKPENLIKKLLESDKTLSGLKVTQVDKLASNAANREKMRREVIKLLTPGSFTDYQIDEALVHVTFTKSGAPWEAVVYLPARYSYGTGRNGVQTCGWDAGPIISFQTRAGKLQSYDAIFTAIFNGSSVDPVWTEAMGKIGNLIVQQRIAAANEAALAARRAAQSAYAQADSNRSTLNRQSESSSRIMSGWTDTVAGTDRWSGGGERHSAPTGYNYGWRASNGNTYYTNDSTFNPNHSSNFSGDWSQMKKTPW